MSIYRARTAELARTAAGETAQPANGAMHTGTRGRWTACAGALLLAPILAIAVFVVLTNVLWRGLAPGEPAPHFAARALSGETIRLADYAGRPVMLTFWSPDCFACREELPALQEVAGNPGVAVITVVSHMPAAEVEAFMRTETLTFPVVVDAEGAIPQQYKVSGIPFTYFIAPDGQIDRAVMGAGEPGDLQSTLQRWLKTCGIDAPCAVSD